MGIKSKYYGLALLALFVCKGALSMTYEDYLDCQIQATQNFVNENHRCDNTQYRYQQSRCLSFAFRKYAAEICSTSASVSLNSISLMYSQLSEVDDPDNFKFYPADKRNKIYSEIKRLIEEESSIAISLAKRQDANVKSAYYESRAAQNLNNTMYYLGATVKNPNQSYNASSTYILNGKVINCSTVGTMTSCL